MSRMELDMTPKTLMNIRIFGAEAFGREVKWRIDRPVAVCATASDEILIADANHCVHVFDQRGGWLRTFGTPGEFAGKMYNILQMCANKTGEFVVVAMKGRQFKFQLYDSNGNFSTEFGKKDAWSCHGIAIDKEDRILSVDSCRKVVIFHRNGNKIVELKCGRCKFPAGIAVNDQELIFIGDRVNHCVQVYTYSGEFRYFIGGNNLTPALIGVAIRGQEDVLLVELRQQKLCVSSFKQDGTWRSYSEAPESFSKGVAFALLPNDNLVVTTKNNKVFIYEQSDKPRAPVQQEHLYQDNVQALQPLQPDNFQASHQPPLQSDGSQAPYQIQPLQHSDFQVSSQSLPQHDNFLASPQHQHLVPGCTQAPYQQELDQNIQAPSQHVGPGGSLTPTRHQHVQSNSVQAFHSSINQTPHQQNNPPFGFQEPYLTQHLQPPHLQPPHLQPPHLQPITGQIVQPHVQSRQPNSSASPFKDQRSRELGLHRPVHFPSNNNEPWVYQQQLATAGAPQQYVNAITTVFAVPLRPNPVPLNPNAVTFLPRGINYIEQYSPRKYLESEQQKAVKRALYEQHGQQYLQKELEKTKQTMKSLFERETAEMTEGLQKLSLPNDENKQQELLLLDIREGPLARSLQSSVDLNVSIESTDHHLITPSQRPCAAPFEAQRINDPTCPLPLRYNNNMFAAQHPAPSTNLEATPDRQLMHNCGYIKDFKKPCAIAVDSEDNVIVVDAFDNRVTVYNKHGKRLFSFGEEGSTCQLVRPRKVAADPQTRSIVVLEDTAVSQIKIFSKEGKFQTSFLSNCIERPRAMTVSKKSEIAVVQFSATNVVVYELSSKLIRTLKCNFKSPTGIAVGDYEFFISDSSDNCVKVYNFNGQLLHEVGNSIDTPSPIGVAIASNGHVAVVDTRSDFRLTLYNLGVSYSAGYYSEKRHRNFEGFALTSTDNVVLICDDGKLWYYDTRRCPGAAPFSPEKCYTSSPRK